MNEYTGPERREHELDHDRLIRLEAIVESIGSDMARLTQTFNDHIEQDREEFAKVHDHLIDMSNTMVRVATEVKCSSKTTSENTDMIAKFSRWQFMIVGGSATISVLAGLAWTVFKFSTTQ